MQPIKVCCFCESWESGGIESFLCSVLCRIDPKRVQIDLVCASQRESIFTQPMKEHGIHFYELSGSQHNLPENYRRFQKLLEKRHYDVLHLNAFHGVSLYYLHLAKRAGVSIRIAHSHNTALRSSRTRPLKLFVHNLAREHFTKDATDLWACSLVAAEFLFPANKLNSFRWISNGIEVERFRFNEAERINIRHQLGLSDAFVIGNIGRLCEQKNQIFLLDVFNEAIKRNPKARLLLIGEGTQADALKQKAERLGIFDKVMFFGVSKQPEKMLWAMDAFAFPSLFEGLGIAIIEAQAAGLPIICSECIPREAYVTPLVHALPLKSGSECWAKALLSVRQEIPRADGWRQIRDADYGIDAVVQKIQESYISQLFKDGK